MSRRNLLNRFKKNKFSGKKDLLFKYFLLALIIQSYSLINLCLMLLIRNKVNLLYQQFFFHGKLVQEFEYTLNLQELMLINKDFPVDGKTAQEANLISLKNFLNLGDTSSHQKVY